MAEIEVNGTTIRYELEPTAAPAGSPPAPGAKPAAGEGERPAAHGVKLPAPGDTVVFLNGVMASYGSWRGMVPAFRKAGYRILLHDFRGQLLSAKPKGPYRFSDHAADLLALLRALGREKPHLVGTSYGGEVGMRFCADHPDAAASLTIIDSVSELDPVLEGLVEGWITLLRGGDRKAFFRAAVPVLYSERFIRENRAMLREREEGFAKLPDDYFTGQEILYRTFLDDLPFTDDLPRIRVPSLVLCGTEDILKPPKFSRIIADHIPGAEYLLVPGAGHVAIFEKERELVSAILGFLGKHAA